MLTDATGEHHSTDDGDILEETTREWTIDLFRDSGRSMSNDLKTPNPSKITNTSKQNPLSTLISADQAAQRTGDPSQFIYDQEARGQQEVVAAAGSRLPSSGTINDDQHAYHEETPMELLWKSWGVVIGKPVENDEIWVHATLPPGWKVTGGDHGMWTNLVDDKGRQRAAIFYKAAFYDRSTFIQPSHRFNATMDREEQADAPYFGIVTDGGEEIRRIGPFTDDEGDAPRFGDPRIDSWKSGYQKSRAAAEAWLDDHRPDWKLLLAYWD